MPSYKITRDHSLHTAHVQAGQPFPVPRKQTLLMAALDAGMDWPYGCRVGVCGRCRCKLLHGSVSQLGDQGLTLGAQAQEDGYILACRSLLESNVLILPPEHAHDASGDMTGTVTGLTFPVDGIAVLTVQLSPPYGSAWQAGQYTRLSVPDAVPPRCFSHALACRGDGVLEFHIRLFPEGLLAEWLTGGDRVGATVTVSQPLGDVSLSLAEPDAPLTFIAGGTGLSPVLAMLEELAASPAPPPVTVLYAARDQAHLYANARIDALRGAWDAGQFTFDPILSREAKDSGWHGRRGHLFDHLDDALTHRDGHAFLCGPPGLVDAAELALLKLRWPRQAITADRFIPAFD